MPVSFESCACGTRYMVPSCWTAYWCAACQRLFERDPFKGTMFFPRRKSA